MVSATIAMVIQVFAMTFCSFSSVQIPIEYSELSLELLQKTGGPLSESLHPHRRRHHDYMIPHSIDYLSNSINPTHKPVRRRMVFDRKLSNSFVHQAEVYGTNYVKEGVFMSTINIGTPQQPFTVILDTGSGDTVIPCEGCNNCGKHMNTPFSLSKSSTGKYSGNRLSISYAEGSSLGGKYITDQVCIGDTCNADQSIGFSFGCATTMTRLFKTQLADGIMGIEARGNTIINAFRDQNRFKKDEFSLCLGLTGGFFNLGEWNKKDHYGLEQWVKYKEKGNWFSVTVNNITVNGKAVSSTSINPIVDSGTTYTYVPRSLAHKLTNVFEDWCNESSQHCLGTKTSSDPDSIYCIRMHESTTLSSLMASLPPITFSLSGQYGNLDMSKGMNDDVKLCFPPEQYLYEYNGSHCVGILGDPDFVIGNNLMMNYDILFDRKNAVLGFSRTDCSLSGKVPTCCGSECVPPKDRKCELSDISACFNEGGTVVGMTSGRDISACKCECNEGYSGSDCSIRMCLISDLPTCYEKGGNAVGKVLGKDASQCKCTCLDGYSGPECGITSCTLSDFPECSVDNGMVVGSVYRGNKLGCHCECSGIFSGLDCTKIDEKAIPCTATDEVISHYKCNQEHGRYGGSYHKNNTAVDVSDCFCLCEDGYTGIDCMTLPYSKSISKIDNTESNWEKKVTYVIEGILFVIGAFMCLMCIISITSSLSNTSKKGSAVHPSKVEYSPCRRESIEEHGTATSFEVADDTDVVKPIESFQDGSNFEIGTDGETALAVSYSSASNTQGKDSP